MIHFYTSIYLFSPFLLVQHIELTMVGAQYSFKIARLETKDGCPLGPGSNLNRTFNMKPLAQSCGQERGLAVDASLSKERDETNLARYTMTLCTLHSKSLIIGILVIPRYRAKSFVSHYQK